MHGVRIKRTLLYVYCSVISIEYLLKYMRDHYNIYILLPGILPMFEQVHNIEKKLKSDKICFEQYEIVTNFQPY